MDTARSPQNASPAPAADEYVEETVPMDPLIELLHLRFSFTSDYSGPADRAEAKNKIVSIIRENNMAPYYELIKELIGSPISQADINEMHKANEAKMMKLEEALKDAEENAGDSEIREALVAKVDHFARIGDRDQCLKLSRECTGKTIAVGPKLDLMFQRVRIGIAFSDHDLTEGSLQEARDLMKHGDWERRNRLKVYEGVFSVLVRDFKKAARLLLDGITTFAATELVSYNEFIFLTVVTSLVTLNRAELKKSIVDSPEVLSSNLPKAIALVSNLYACKYNVLFEDLAEVCHEMRRNVFLALHVNYFFREVRILAFHQFLDSYSSVTLASMANTFKIPVGGSIDNLVGQIKSKILLWLNEIDGRFHDMVLLVKEWAKAHDINNSKQGTFNSYSLSLLVIFHFQTCSPAIFPPLRDIYPGNVVDNLKGVRAEVENEIAVTCATNIARFKSRTANRSSLSELFVSFLAKFSDISSKASELGICPFTGQWLEIESNMRWLPKTYAIFVEDPFEQPENTARAINARQLTRISEAFRMTHLRLTSVYQNQSSILNDLARPQILQLIMNSSGSASAPAFNVGNYPPIRPQVHQARVMQPRPWIQHQFQNDIPRFNMGNFPPINSQAPHAGTLQSQPPVQHKMPKTKRIVSSPNVLNVGEPSNPSKIYSGQGQQKWRPRSQRQVL